MNNKLGVNERALYTGTNQSLSSQQLRSMGKSMYFCLKIFEKQDILPAI